MMPRFDLFLIHFCTAQGFHFMRSGRKGEEVLGLFCHCAHHPLRHVHYVWRNTKRNCVVDCEYNQSCVNVSARVRGT